MKPDKASTDPKIEELKLRYQFATGYGYLKYFIEGQRIGHKQADDYLEMFDHPGMEDMFVSMVTIYKSRFPQSFEKLNPRNFVLPAAMLSHTGKVDELNRLQNLVAGNKLLEAGVEEGMERAAKLKLDQALNAIQESLWPSDLAQRPNDATLVPGHK